VVPAGGIYAFCIVSSICSICMRQDYDNDKVQTSRTLFTRRSVELWSLAEVVRTFSILVSGLPSR
jgi:hypothetical protein